MISINNLTVSFGGYNLYDSISFLINKNDKIGLAGKNGAGKSTLLKIIAGMQSPTSGEVAKPNSCRIGYLPQDMIHNLGKTVWQETESAFTEIKQLEKKIEAVVKAIEESTDYESEGYMKLLNDLHEYNEQLSVMGAAETDAAVEQTLLGLGFERADFTRLMDEFSGGWRMRVELAKLLLQKPDLLLLDEPTNHLDIESIQWLEDFLVNYPGAIVMVSHDKTFLDNITSRTIEISLGKIYDYKANYSKYLLLRKERKEQQAAAAKNQQKYIDKTQQLIDKYRAKANKASFAQSLIKKLDKIDIIEVDEDDTAAIRFRFAEPERSGKVVVEAINVSKKYDSKEILKNIEYMIERGDKIAFVGRNGEGKSTMSKIIAGEIPCEGEMKIGHNVMIGYFAQNQSEILNPNKTVFETIDEIAEGDIRKNVRGILGSFLFSGEDVDKKVKVLSGGEKNRLAMCKLLLKPYNLLVLDEPTNHLDIRSKEVLKSALINYSGTVVIVSHDRDFLTGLTNRVFEFKSKTVRQHIGDVNEYLEKLKLESFRQLEVGAVKQTAVREDSKEDVVTEENEKEIKAIRTKIAKLEKEIKNIEDQILEFDKKLSDPELYKELLNDNAGFSKYEKLKLENETKTKEWEQLQTALENLI